LPVSRIACIAWGSLVWDPRTLPLAGEFREDGPWLSVEFSRVALDGRVTLILDPTARAVRTHWVPLAVESLEEAVTALGMREKIAPGRRPDWVGRMRRTDPTPGFEASNPAPRALAAWLEERELDAVVWTALPARGPDGASKRPDFDCLLRHLEALEGEARIRAEEYIRRAPSSIDTDHRAKFEDGLGWVVS